MANGAYRLVMAQGPTPGKVYELVKDIMTIGRDVSNDIVINDAEVSRHHARLTRQVGGYMLEDLSSTNGTFVNGQRLIGPRPLSRGDNVGLGETVVLGYEQVPSAESNQATMVSSGVGSYPQPAPQQQYAPPEPAYAPPQPAYAPPQPAYAPEPAPFPPAPPPPAPAAKGGSRTNMYIGIGCGCLLLIAACVAVIFALDAYAPDLLYGPLQGLGF
jgi:pSer/pThr/pTyr-binding forkhead associated (FHA) protein